MTEGPKGASALSAAINLAKLCIGSGILALPYATSKGGLVVGPIVIGIIAVWNGIACSLMIECKEAIAHKTFPVQASSTYSKIAYAGLGKVGMAVTEASVVITLLGVCVAYEITFAALLFGMWGMSYQKGFLTLLCGLLAFPMCCVHDVGRLASLSLAGLLCLFAGLLAILAYGYISYSSAMFQSPLVSLTTGDSLPLLPQSTSALASFVGITTFCFGLCTLAFPIQESMERKEDFPKAVRWSLAFVWAVYVAVGSLGALLYLQHPLGISDHILADLPETSLLAVLVRIAMSTVCVLTLPLPFLPAAQLLEQVWLHGCRTMVMNGYQSISSKGDDEQGEEEFSFRHSEPAPHWQLCLHRLVLMGFCTFLAASLPCFAMVISILGGFTVAVLSFVLPPLLHLRIISMPALEDASNSGGLPVDGLAYLSKDDAKRGYWWDVCLTVAGGLLSLLATCIITADCLRRLEEGTGCN